MVVFVVYPQGGLWQPAGPARRIDGRALQCLADDSNAAQETPHVGRDLAAAAAPESPGGGVRNSLSLDNGFRGREYNHEPAPTVVAQCFRLDDFSQFPTSGGSSRDWKSLQPPCGPHYPVAVRPIPCHRPAPCFTAVPTQPRRKQPHTCHRRGVALSDPQLNARREPVTGC